MNMKSIYVPKALLISFCLLFSTLLSACQNAPTPEAQNAAPKSPNSVAKESVETKNVTKAAIDTTTSVMYQKDRLAADTTSGATHMEAVPFDFGTYEATFPCTGCAGVYTLLTINQDGSYVLTETFQDPVHGDESNTSKGTWTQVRRKIVLKDTKNKVERPYTVIEKNRLEMLAMNGSMITTRTPEVFQLKKKDS
jgi:uncharacterized lipoprotein NlpE involved in copper resistance